MDYGFMQSILNSWYFPPPDMWYPPLPINYYYFGHLVTALLTKLSGLDLAYTFNLMLAAIFALCFTMSFSIGYQISDIGHRMKRITAGVLTAYLVTLAGNMQTIYAFTRGYTGDDVRPFWELLWKAGELVAKLPQGMETYWYANATRFIPYAIHEFPSYSFVVSDVHGHVLSIPFVLLAIGLLVTLWGAKGARENWGTMLFYGFLCGVLLMTNALDGPIYLGLFAVLLFINRGNRGDWGDMGKRFGIVVLAAGLTSLPFLAHFKSFVNGIAINCPLPFLANSRIGPIIFEGVEKCQRSPVWMLWVLWGFFLYCGTALITRGIGEIRGNFREVWGKKYTQLERVLIIFFVFSLLLIIFPELFYFKDIYPQHFRSNTMFKLGYQAFILFSIIAGYTIVQYLGSRGDKGARGNWGRTLFFLFLAPQLFLVFIYPLFSVRSYFGALKRYEGIYGLAWLEREHPGDYRTILWLKENTTPTSLPVIVESDGDSYSPKDENRISAFSGIPTVIGWAVHEWLWRGTYDVVSPRREDVRRIYESDNLEEIRQILGKYGVRYIVVGRMERERFASLDEQKFATIGTTVFQSGETVLYEVAR